MTLLKAKISKQQSWSGFLRIHGAESATIAVDGSAEEASSSRMRTSYSRGFHCSVVGAIISDRAAQVPIVHHVQKHPLSSRKFVKHLVSYLLSSPFQVLEQPAYAKSEQTEVSSVASNGAGWRLLASA